MFGTITIRPKGVSVVLQKEEVSTIIEKFLKQQGIIPENEKKEIAALQQDAWEAIKQNKFVTESNLRQALQDCIQIQIVTKRCCCFYTYPGPVFEYDKTRLIAALKPSTSEVKATRRGLGPSGLPKVRELPPGVREQYKLTFS